MKTATRESNGRKTDVVQADPRVLFLTSHPVQAHVPLLKRLAAEPDLHVRTAYLSTMATGSYYDSGFAQTIQWDIPLRNGYEHEFLPAYGRADTRSFLRPWNRGLASRINTESVDALWLGGYGHLTCLRAAWLASRRGVPVLMWGDSNVVQVRRSGGSALLKAALLRRLFARCDAFLAVGTNNRAYYEHYGARPEAIFHFPYCVDNEFFQREVAVARANRDFTRHRLGLVPGRPIVLFAGKLIPLKRVEDLIAAIGKLQNGQLRSPPYLLCVGNGTLRSRLESMALRVSAESIRFLGFRNQTELPALYDLCDVLVLPSDREAWGLVVNEAMNAAKPVICTDRVGCAPDLIEVGVNGYVVPARDVQALSRAIADVLSDMDRARAMGQASLNRINGWSFEQCVTGLKEALEWVRRR